MGEFKGLDQQILALIKQTSFESVGQYYTVLDNFCRSVCNSLAADRVSVWLYRREKKSIFCSSLYLKKTDNFQRGTELFSSDYENYFRALEQGMIIEAPDANNSEATSCFSDNYLKPLGIHSMIDAPIWSSGEMIGVLCVEYFQLKKEWSPEEKNFVISIAGHLGSVVERKKTFDYIEDLRKQTFALDEHNLVSITDLRGRITYCNDRFIEVSKYNREELVGKDHRVINSGYHPKEFWKEIWNRILSGRSWQGEIKNRAKDGTYYWVESTISPIRNQDGKIVELISIRTDITHKKAQEEALKKSNQQIAALNKLLNIDHGIEKSLHQKLASCLQHILKVGWLDILGKGGVFLTDGGKLKLFVSNNLGETIENMCSEVVAGRCLCGRAFEQKKTVHADCVDERHENTFEGIAPHGHYNVPLMRGDEVIGVLVLYLSHGHKRNDEEIKFLEACCDVMSQIIIDHRNEEEIIKARDMAMIAEKAKSEFLANMSHEIRTPMNGVLGMAQVLSETNLTHEQREMIEIIQSSGDSLLTILNDILDLSKIEAGRFDLEIVNFNLKKCVEEAMYLLSYRASQKGVDLIEKYDEKLPKFFLGDVTRIRQILVNYISNAIKFTEKGSVTIEISPLEINPDSAKIKISVIDTGIGIPREAQEKLFQAFTQADNSITRQFGGTGLGLSICSKLTELMGGEVHFESTEGVGSTFSSILTFAFGEERDDHQVAMTSEEDNNFSELYPHHVLIVEDNIVNQKLVKLLLQKIGYSFEIANNGVHALDILKKEREKDFSLILMDIQMPEMDGVSATKEIIKMYGNQYQIVALTANAFEEDRRECLEAGMIDFITKPVKFEELKRVFKTYSKKTSI
ncbi:ATP-binding protein [Bacteriovorax sp. DB6_IX]|uniref:ATP-binding protein n=2 Tax=Bacteriovorax sp. DB6_IX TaxID=1353530 RepID=UPI00038A1BC5|nr:ATP-binding protein [Bacteriovorax sp. DB6_IX]EQC50411.1 PAS domain S-box protein [Bacteriovorax sp. DB6_IX]